MGSSARRQLLTALCTAAGGRAHVAGLCELTGLSRGAISRHLRALRLRGLVHGHPEGRHVWYHCDPRRVRLDKSDKGYALTLTQPSGVELTLGMPTAAATAAYAPPAEAPRVDASEAAD